METAPEPLWEPAAEQVEASTLTRYTSWIEARLDREFADYEALWRWSVEDLDGFWRSIWDYFGLDGSPAAVLGRREMPGAEWFPGVSLNYAARIFQDVDDSAVAIRFSGELTGGVGELTWAELRALIAGIAGGLRAAGVGRGDRVAAYVPNVPEAVAAFLACASLGAVWSSCSPDFGARSVIDRFAQIEPKVLIAVDGYRYSGRDFDRRDVVAGLRAQMPSVESTVLLP